MFVDALFSLYNSQLEVISITSNSRVRSLSSLSGCGRSGIRAGGKGGGKLQACQPAAEVPSGVPGGPGNPGFTATSVCCLYFASRFRLKARRVFHHLFCHLQCYEHFSNNDNSYSNQLIRSGQNTDVTETYTDTYK